MRAALLFLATVAFAAEPQIIYLWPQGAPGSEGKTGEEAVRINQPGSEHVVSNIHKPSITVYLPPKESASHAGVIVMPGGGHRELWMDHEGYNVAKWLSDHGVAAFVLKYRLVKTAASEVEFRKEMAAFFHGPRRCDSPTSLELPESSVVARSECPLVPASP